MPTDAIASIVWVRAAQVPVAALAERLHPQGVSVVESEPAHAPDLILASWSDSERLLDGLPPAWLRSPPPAQLYLAPADWAGREATQLSDPLADALLLPVDIPQLVFAILRGLSRRDQHLGLSFTPTPLNTASEPLLVGTSRALEHAITTARRVAESAGTSVLIEGESGTGKELVAQLIHGSTPGRRHRPFIDVNCAAIPSDLLEAELFGYERGAFTDASHDKAGLMELAHGGTLFLDEVAELPMALQAKLLRVLETRSFRRLGAIATRHANTRVIASSNRTLTADVQQGLFRLDLYHRLAIVTIHLPPLRDRPEDIVPLAEHFLRQLAPAAIRRAVRLSEDAQQALQAHWFPGNIRELRNTIQRALIMSAGPVITSSALGLEGLAGPTSGGSRTAPGAGREAPPETLADCERAHIRAMLHRTRGNRAMAARLLQISLPTLYNKIRKYNLADVGRAEPATADTDHAPALVPAPSRQRATPSRF